MTLLTVDGVTKRFGGVAANEDVTFAVEQGELASVVGPNGAGKTTLLNQIAGHLSPDSGRIVFAGQALTGKRADQVCSSGIARTFQIVRIFPRLSVLDNVITGALLRERHVRAAERLARSTLDRVGLADQEDRLARELPLAARRRIEVARALATQPRLLLLDEAMSGLNETETRDAVELVRALRKDLTIVMVEHVMEIVMRVSDRVIVLVEGRKLKEGAPEEISRDPDVIVAYLGRRFVAGA